MPRGKNKATLEKEEDIRRSITNGIPYCNVDVEKDEAAKYRNVVKGMQDEYAPDYGLVVTYSGKMLMVERVPATLIHRGRVKKVKIEKIVHPAGEYEVGDHVEHVAPSTDMNTHGVFRVKRIYENGRGEWETECWGGESESWRCFFRDKLRRA